MSRGMRYGVPSEAPMRAFLIGLMLLAPVALAQDEAPEAPEAPEAATSAAAPANDIAVGATVFALADTPSTRFPDSDEDGPTFTPGSKLLVLVSEGARLRVMSAADNQFGWVPAGSVTAKKPDVDLDALLQSLGGDAGGAGAE